MTTLGEYLKGLEEKSDQWVECTEAAQDIYDAGEDNLFRYYDLAAEANIDPKDPDAMVEFITKLLYEGEA